jgi:hypothetical protein
MAQASTAKKTTAPAKTPKNRIETPLEKPRTNGDFDQKVAQKAYELYVARGCAHGHDVEDWIQAVKIVKGS